METLIVAWLMMIYAHLVKSKFIAMLALILICFDILILTVELFFKLTN
jgi:ATP/ADP translocase